MWGSLSRSSCGLQALAVAALLAGPVRGAAAGLPIAPGDTLRIAVAGAPELGRDEAKVDADGSVALAGLNGIAVAGVDLDTARQRISEALVAHQILKSPAVLVEVVSYRPFYVGGAVAHPGAITFEPGLTVRHALILAGGVERSDGEEKLTSAELVDLKAKYQMSAYALAAGRSQIARLTAELDEKAAPDFASVDKPGPVADASSPIVSIDNSLFSDEMSAWRADQDHLQESVALIDFEIDVLARQKSLQQDESTLQDEQLRAARSLVEKGMMPLPRLQELEREASRLSRDLLDNEAYSARARQNRQSGTYQIDTAATKRRIELREALRTAMIDQTKLEAENQVLSTALISAGIALAGDGSSEELAPQVSIIRAVDGVSQTIAATLDAPIVPGDVLDVAVAAGRR